MKSMTICGVDSRMMEGLAYSLISACQSATMK